MFCFFLQFWKFFGNWAYFVSRKNYTQLVSPKCTLLSSSPSSTDRQLFPSASLYGTYVFTLSLPVHCDAHHKRHAYKGGGALEVIVQPPKRTTNCRRLRASNRLLLTILLCFLALAWVYAWSVNPRNERRSNGSWIDGIQIWIMEGRGWTLEGERERERQGGMWTSVQEREGGDKEAGELLF